MTVVQGVFMIVTLTFVTLTFAGEPNGNQTVQPARPRTPREANKLKLALRQQQQEQSQRMAEQQWAQLQQSLQREAFAQLSREQQTLQQQMLLQQPGTRVGSHVFPKNGAFVYEGNGSKFGGAMPRYGAYVYQGSGGSIDGGAIPMPGAYAYHGSGGATPRNGAYAYRNGK